MIYAKAVPYTDPTQVGIYFISWAVVQPMLSQATVDTAAIPDDSFTAYDVPDPTHLTIINGVISVI